MEKFLYKMNEYELDAKQLMILSELEEIHKKIEKNSFTKFLKKLFLIKSKPCLGLYIYGDVGRGKSMLLKRFYQSLTKTPKLYCHFNSFMKAIHEAFRDVRKEQVKHNDQLIEAINRVIDPNLAFYKRFIDDYDEYQVDQYIKVKKHKAIKVLCLDEFQIMDSADSMILSRILTYLLQKNIAIVFTSNCHPLDLYKNGIQADLFQDFVKDVLLPKCPAIKLKSDQDYREIKSGLKSSTRFFVSDKNYDIEINDIINQITIGKIKKKTRIKVWGRELIVDNSYNLTRNDINFLKLRNLSSPLKKGLENKIFHNNQAKTLAIFTFEELCRNNYFSADYQAICQNFDLILLVKIPQLQIEDTNEARRLTLFIDEVYENKNSFIALSAKAPEEIYSKGTGSKSFLRTVSRLKEMQSDEYWVKSKIFD